MILIDAAARGEQPGTISVIEPDLSSLDGSEAEQADPHGMDPIEVLRMVRSMGGEFPRILLLACEPATFGLEDEGAKTIIPRFPRYPGTTSQKRV